MGSMMLISGFHIFTLPQTTRNESAPSLDVVPVLVLLSFNHCCNVYWEKNQWVGRNSGSHKSAFFLRKPLKLVLKTKPSTVCPPRSTLTLVTMCSCSRLVSRTHGGLLRMLCQKPQVTKHGELRADWFSWTWLLEWWCGKPWRRICRAVPEPLHFWSLPL